MLSVSAHSFYKEIAQNQHVLDADILPNRGEVYCKNGQKDIYPLATNKQYPTIYVSPKEIANKEEVVKFLVDELEIDKETAFGYFDDPDDPFEVVLRKADEEYAKKVEEYDAKGIYVMYETFRYYPGDTLGSQVLGFVGHDGEGISGRYGIEAYWEEILRGDPGYVSQERDARGGWISVSGREFQPAKNGKDIILTLDAGVQYEVERVLKERVEQHDADSASAIVLEVGTGKILAMANMPTFDPNEFSSVKDMGLFLNPAVSHVYESGSVFKPVTLAIGLDAGVIEPDTTYIDTGVIYEAGYEIMNSDEESYGRQTMTQVLEESLNTGTIFVQKKVGNKDFKEYVERFGFGEKTGVELPSESRGNISNLEYLQRDINFYTASFGQGISMTLLQLAQSYDVLANGGVLMRPHIVDSLISEDGEREEIEPEVLRRVITEETSFDIREMLYSVVEKGHGSRARVPGYRVGGKTGTAQVAKKDERGYSDEKSIGTFAGLAPIDDPRFVVVVKIRNPKDVIWAESSAAPAFGEIMKFLLDYYNVNPTEEIEI